MDPAESQAENPYAPPAAMADAEGYSTKRHPWIAVVLAVLLPAFGLLYAARGRRALAYVAATFGVSLLVVGLCSYAGAKFILTSAVGSIALFTIAAVDGYRCARAWPESNPLPWYARRPVLASIIVVTLIGFVAFRAFVTQPYNTASASMQPTLLKGDFLLVNKSVYGLRLPRGEGRFAGRGVPERGDLSVFRYPENPDMHYVKRVIGLPGDIVEYAHKQLSINGHEVPRTIAGRGIGDAEGWAQTMRYRETLGARSYEIEIDPEAPPIQRAAIRNFPGRDQCEYSDRGFRCVVPAGNYFVMGDNRDSSSDSRYWGFVPEDNLIGRAFMIWASEGRPERIGMKID